MYSINMLFNITLKPYSDWAYFTSGFCRPVWNDTAGNKCQRLYKCGESVCDDCCCDEEQDGHRHGETE